LTITTAGGSVERLTEQRERAGRFRSRFDDELAFRSWYDGALPRVYAYLFPRCGGNRTMAEELTQATFEEAIRSRATFDGRADEITWIVSIAKNKLVDHYRRLARDERRHLTLVEGWRRTTGDVADAVTTNTQVRDILAQLPALQRAALALHYLDGMSSAEIAYALGKSEGAVESLLSRGRTRFRELVGTGEEGR
jgi:RNA polymerase sigma-70 factor (ECF subfamily)